MNLVKARIPSGYCVGNLSLLEICLATIGVCVFRCVASVTHFLIYNGVETSEKRKVVCRFSINTEFTIERRGAHWITNVKNAVENL